jgi:hypothetical protein
MDTVQANSGRGGDEGEADGTSAKRERRSLEEKRRIVEETVLEGVSVARVARAHGLNANHLLVQAVSSGAPVTCGLFVSQRDDGIDTNRPPRGNTACCQANNREQTRYNGVGDRIARLHSSNSRLFMTRVSTAMPAAMPKMAPEFDTFDQATHDLHLLLENAGIRGPYVLVGHSLVGMLVRFYQAKYPKYRRSGLFHFV